MRSTAIARRQKRTDPGPRQAQKPNLYGRRQCRQRPSGAAPDFHGNLEAFWRRLGRHTGEGEAMTDRHFSAAGPSSLSGQVVQSDFQPGVSYRLERCIGEGGMGQAFLALRHAPDGISPVVIKVVRPTAESGAQNSASILVQKEAVALGRLNERIPPCPFVVRLVDTGSTYIGGTGRQPTPWLAVEYVHGGIEGTTLDDRVKGSIERTAVGFDVRARRTRSSVWRRGYTRFTESASCIAISHPITSCAAASGRRRS